MVAVASIPSEVPGIRIADGHVPNGQRETATRGQAEVNRSGRYVLYWMIAHRRLRSNFALQRAADWARHLSLPLVVLEPLEVDYRWASERFHAFVIAGMQENRRRAASLPLTYLPYVEPSSGAGDGLLARMAESAAVVVTDDFPCFFHPALVRSAARHVSCRFEVVDGNGLIPLSSSPREFARAFDFRRFLQRTVRDHWEHLPQPLPFEGLRGGWEPGKELDAWPMLDANEPLETLVRQLPIDHAVGRSSIPGGSEAGERRAASFIAERLDDYADHRNDVDRDGASGLSPYLHFGHVSVHDLFRDVTERYGWKPQAASTSTGGSSHDWWGLPPGAESFLDELLTWRELGYHFSRHRRDYARYESLPDWARRTLEEHAKDRRDAVYSLDEFAESRTHDELWNAAQRQLVREGKIHNYLRMLWGKKILEWSAHPRDALHVMIELNNRYALDGRNPNSYSGIFWVLGRFDRAWGPERPVYGTIRYMSSDNTRRKLPVRDYLRRYAAAPQVGLPFSD
ncbi:MAG TPA: deoxyribodipyrimidine photolyase [Planctomycetaceae bacterium]|nr:deoxyribodipyrimidine photolyase [Planctomycetaceae bacterium]HRE99856.1 deoxyribodipyrimidine photolyase [Pirellulaceae bacterium]